MLARTARTLLVCSLLCSVLASCAAPQEPASDSLITGDAIGPVTMSMTESDVIAAVGAASIERREAYLGEGYCALATHVFPDTSSEIEILGRDSTYSEIVALTIDAPGAPWRTRLGVGVGSTLTELESLAGHPISFAGFEFDNAGAATWSEPGAELAIRVRLPAGWETTIGTDPRFDELVGDRPVSSDHPLIRSVNVTVWRLSLRGSPLGPRSYSCS